MKKCVLEPKKNCTNCNECTKCDIDSSKICDNCMKCVDTLDGDYAVIDAQLQLEKEKKKK